MTSHQENLKIALWVAIGLLLAAILPIWPYGIYTLLRLVVTLVAIYGIFALGTKDHFITGNGLDPSDKDDKIAKIRKHKVAKHAVEVVLIVHRDVPEYALVAQCSTERNSLTICPSSTLASSCRTTKFL